MMGARWIEVVVVGALIALASLVFARPRAPAQRPTRVEGSTQAAIQAPSSPTAVYGSGDLERGGIWMFFNGKEARAVVSNGGKRGIVLALWSADASGLRFYVKEDPQRTQPAYKATVVQLDGRSALRLNVFDRSMLLPERTVEAGFRNWALAQPRSDISALPRWWH